MKRLHEGWDYSVYNVYIWGGLAALVAYLVVTILRMEELSLTNQYRVMFPRLLLPVMIYISGILLYWWWVFLFEGDMRDLSAFADASFDLIVHPVSNVFVPEVRPVWREAYRVLRYGDRRSAAGVLLAGFTNPVIYLFDWTLWEQGQLEVRHALPYSDVEALSEAQKTQYRQEGIPFEFSHTLEDQIGGQLDAGFVLAGLYEDYAGDDSDPLSHYMPTYLATRALKM